MSAKPLRQAEHNDHAHDQHDDDHHQDHHESMDHDELAERRLHGDGKSRERRVIPRLGHPEIRKNLRHTQVLCSVGVGFAGLYIAGMIARHLRDSNLELNRSIFFGVVIAILASGFVYLGSAIRSYVENESQQRMITVTDRLFKAFFLFVVTGLILGVVDVITWF